MVGAQPDRSTSSHERVSGGILTYSVSMKWLHESSELRLDAGHYSPALAKALSLLRQSKMELRPLAEVTERIFIPPRFKRIYVEQEYGVPFLQGGHLVQAQPADMKFLSKTAHKGLERWIIRKGWVLVTCSGTIGRTTIAPPSWDEWAASQHIMRIVPRNDGPCPAGYVYAFLRSPAGQAQLIAQIYGAVVDELTESHGGSVLIPIPRSRQQKEAVMAIHETVMASILKKDAAVKLADDALSQTIGLLAQHDTEATGGGNGEITRGQFFNTLGAASRPQTDVGSEGQPETGSC